jgi:hypothetical protein
VVRKRGQVESQLFMLPAGADREFSSSGAGADVVLLVIAAPVAGKSSAAALADDELPLDRQDLQSARIPPVEPCRA